MGDCCVGTCTQAGVANRFRYFPWPQFQCHIAAAIWPNLSNRRSLCRTFSHYFLQCPLEWLPPFLKHSRQCLRPWGEPIVEKLLFFWFAVFAFLCPYMFLLRSRRLACCLECLLFYMASKASSKQKGQQNQALK